MNPPKPKKSLCGYPFTACNSKSSHAKDCPMGEKVGRKKMVVASHRPSQRQQNDCTTKTKKRVVKIDNSFWKNNTSSASSYSLTEKDFDSIMKNMKRVVCEKRYRFSEWLNGDKWIHWDISEPEIKIKGKKLFVLAEVLDSPQKTRGGKVNE